jgi:hypothetical protein
MIVGPGLLRAGGGLRSKYAQASVALDFIGRFYKFGGTISPSLPGTFTRASTGTATTSLGNIVSFGSGVPRITDLGLLVEESRTNLALRSGDISNAAWSKLNASVTANAAVAPDGTLTGAKIVEDGTLNQHGVLQTLTVVSGSAYTQSVFAKAGERTWLYMTEGNNVTATAWFNLATGALGTVSGTGSPSATITPLGNGWYRCALTFTPIATSANIQVRPTTANGSSSAYQGDGASGLYAWGGQLELGAFSTSYIPTTSASATRAADVSTMVLAAMAQGTMFVNALASVNDGSSRRAVSINDGTVNNEISTNLLTATSKCVVVTGGVTQASINLTSPGWVGPKKTAIAFALNDFAATSNSDAPVIDSSGTVPTTTTLDIGQVAGSAFFCGYIRQVIIYNSRLPNAQLQAITSSDPTIDLNFSTGLYQSNSSSYNDPTVIPGFLFSRASTGTAPNAAGTVLSFASGQPRITDLGLLVEESRTNLALRSQAFTAGVWSGNVSPTITDNAVVAPDGTTTGAQITAVTGGSGVYQIISTTAATTYTASIYIRPTGPLLALDVGNDAVSLIRSRFTYTLGSWSIANTGGAIGSVVAAANGWYRLIVTLSAPAGTISTLIMYNQTGSTQTWNAWGAQWELGAFPTSYIPTTSAAATRAADVASFSGLVYPVVSTLLLYGTAPVGVSTDARIFTNDGSAANRIGFIHDGTSISPQVQVGSVTQNTNTSVLLAAKAPFKAGLSYDGAIWHQGLNGAVTTANAGSTPAASITVLSFHNNAGSQTRFWNGYIQRLVILPVGYTDSQLIAITT